MKTIHYKLYTNFYEVMNMEQIDFMKEAYGELYKIEISLRILIHEVMTEEYGPGWLIKAPVSMGYRPYQKPLSSFYYHELISLLSSYPCLKQIFREDCILLLRNTISIRNNIAHCKSIQNDEFKKLVCALKEIKEITNVKNRSFSVNSEELLKIMSK